MLQEIGKAFTDQTGMPVRFSFAASSALARQIESGAPAGVFVSADEDWMNYLAARELIRAATRADVASNSLVLVAPGGQQAAIEDRAGLRPCAGAGQRGRIATGDPDSVPAGKYAKAALISLGVWDGVANRIVPAENVRSALNFVSLGETPLGIVYATDARADATVRVVDTFPASTHDADHLSGRGDHPRRCRCGSLREVPARRPGACHLRQVRFRGSLAAVSVTQWPRRGGGHGARPAALAQQRNEAILRHGRAVQKALRLVATQMPEQIELSAGLDTFRDRGHVEGARQRDDGLDQAGAGRAFQQTGA